MGTAGVVEDDDEGTAVGVEPVPPPEEGDLGESGIERGRGGYWEAADEVFERLIGMGCCMYDPTSRERELSPEGRGCMRDEEGDAVYEEGVGLVEERKGAGDGRGEEERVPDLKVWIELRVGRRPRDREEGEWEVCGV